ncbi:hypothetical protein ABGB08_31970 [Acrocarpospora sp. B8E8]
MPGLRDRTRHRHGRYRRRLDDMALTGRRMVIDLRLPGPPSHPGPGRKVPSLMDEIFAKAGIETVLTGIRMPRMNAIMERWVQSCRHELLDRCLI